MCTTVSREGRMRKGEEEGGEERVRKLKRGILTYLKIKLGG